MATDKNGLSADQDKELNTHISELIDAGASDSDIESFTNDYVKKKVVTTPSESLSQDGAKVLSDVSEQSKQGVEPLSQPTERKEPSKLPETYVSNHSNYKDLVEGQDYILNRGGKPITGKWDATKQEFVKNPLLDATKKEKTKGFVEGAVEMVAAGVPLKSYETETDVLARNAVEAENLKQEAAQKALHANQIAKIPEINQLDELYKQLPSHPELQKQIDEISNTPITEKQFQGTRFISGSEGKVFQNIDTTIPTEDYNGKLMPMKNNEWLNDYKDAKTIGDVYNRVKEDVDYVQTVQAETNQFEDKLLKKRVSDLPEEEQNYLKQLEGSENYKDEALKILQNSNETKNVVDAGLLGVYDNVESIINTGNNRGLSDKQWNEKQANDFMYDNLFKKHPVTQAQQLTHSIGNMIPSLAAAPLSGGASLSLMAYPMMHEYEKEYYRDAIAQGKTPRKADAEQYAMASTATQMTMLLGAGAVGGKAMQLVGKSKLQRVGELLLEVGKRGAKDAVGFGLGGAYLQNKINKAFDVSENDDYARSALNMGLIGSTFGLVHGVGQAFKFKLPKKLVNEIDYHASYLPKELISSEISKLVNSGKISTADALETDKKIDRFRQIRNQLNVDLSFEQMESIDKVWVEKQKLEESMKDASPEIKNIIKGQIEDLDRKAIIESLIPLSSNEKEELKNLTTKRATEGNVDEVRLKFLQDRKDAIEKAKQSEENKAEKKTATETIEEKGVEEPKEEVKAEVETPTETIQEKGGEEEGSVGVGGDVDFTAKGGNKVVNEKGEPLVVYHGTSKGLKAEDLKQSGQAGDYGEGIYFATDKREAEQRNAENIIEANVKSDKHLVIGSKEYFDGIYKTLEKKYGSVIPQYAIGAEAKKAGYTSIEVERPEGKWIIAFDGAKIQSLKETPTPKGNTSNVGVEEGSVGVGGDVGSKSILKSDVDLKGDKKKSWMRKNSLDKISVNDINEEGHNNNLSSAKENVKAGKKSQTKEAPLVEIDENGNATIIDGHHRIAEDILDGKSHIEAVVDNKFNIRDAIKDGLYEKAISEGRMTAKDAKEIIESAGLKIPKAVEQSLKETTKAENKPTISKEQQPTDVAKEEGSGGVGGDVTEAEKMQFGAGYKDYNFKKENVPTSKIKITEQPSLSERKDLVEDIKKNGIKEPIVVEYDKESDTYYVKNGNNRAAIAKELGITEVPTIIAEYKEQSLKETTKAETIVSEKPVVENKEVPKSETKVDFDGNEIGSKSYQENKPTQLVGREREKVVADGTKIKGTYKVVSADDVIASHNEETFSKEKGFPTKDGKTINDRDYEKDNIAQQEVVRIANELDQRAVAQTPIVTKEGVVIDGNNRTMSRKLAAKQGTDKAYLDALQSEADMYGIDPNEISKIKNPMLVFEPTEDLPYTTETLKRFNVTEKKEKSTIEKAVEISKTISDKVRSIMNSIYDNADRPSDITSDPKAMAEIRKTLLDAKIWQPNEIAKYINAETGTATKSGVEFLETLLMGSSLDENTIRMLNAEGMGNARNMVLKAIVPLTKNSTMGENSLTPNIAKGIELLNQAKNAKSNVISMINQLGIFEQAKYSAEDLALATLLESGGLKKFLNEYNSKVGKNGLFGEITKSGEIDEFLRNEIKNYEQIRSNLRINEPIAEAELPKGDGIVKQENDNGIKEEAKHKGEPDEKPKSEGGGEGGKSDTTTESKGKQPDKATGQGEVTGKDKIARGLDALSDILGGKLKAFSDSEKPKVVNALRDIAEGLIEEGKATIDNVVEKLYEYVKDKMSKEDYDSIKNDVKKSFESTSATNEKAKEEVIGTGIKKAMVVKDRDDLGLPPIELPKADAVDIKLQKAKELVDSGEINATELESYLIDHIDNIDEAKTSVLDEYVLNYQKMKLMAEKKRLISQKLELEDKLKENPNDAKTELDLASLEMERQANIYAIDRNTKATLISSNKWAKTGEAKQQVLDEQGLIQQQIKRIKEVHNSNIPENVKVELDKLQSKNEELAIKLELIEKKLSEKIAQDNLVSTNRENRKPLIGRSNRRNETEIRADIETAKERLKNKVAQRLEKFAVKNFAQPQETKSFISDIAPDIMEIVKGHAEIRGNKLVDVINDTYDTIKDIVDGVNKDDIRDVIAGKYSDKKPLSELRKQMNDLRSQANIMLRLEELENGIVRETKKRGESSPEVKALKKEQEEIRKQALNEFSELSANELKKQADIIQKKIEKGEFAKAPSLKKQFQNDSEWIKADQERKKVKERLNQLEWEALQGKKNKLMKVEDIANDWLRRLLFIPSQAYQLKLGAAAASSYIHQPIEALLSEGLNKIIPQISKRAPIEGGGRSASLHAQSLAKLYGELNPMKVIKNTKDILLTGQTELGKELSHYIKNSEQSLFNPLAEHNIIDWIAADPHQILKDPVKRGTFESALVKYFDYYETNGIPLNAETMERARQASYMKAENEIFLGKESSGNVIGDYFNKIAREGIHQANSKSGLERVSGNTKYTLASLYKALVPINTVPTNIISRVVKGNPLVFISKMGTAIRANKELNKGIEETIMKMTNEQSDKVVRDLKKGAIGSVYWTLGMLMAGGMAGGKYSRIYKDEDRDKNGDLEHDKLKIGKLDIPHGAQHATQLESIQMGATMGLTMKYLMKDKGDSFGEAFIKSGLNTTGDIAEEIPTIDFLVRSIEGVRTEGGLHKMGKDYYRRSTIPQAKSFLKKMGANIESEPIELSSKSFNTKKAKDAEAKLGQEKELDTNEKYQVGKTTYEYKDGAWEAIEK